MNAENMDFPDPTKDMLDAGEFDRLLHVIGRDKGGAGIQAHRWRTAGAQTLLQFRSGRIGGTSEAAMD